jgi:plasmid stabilization system protein ParE
VKRRIQLLPDAAGEVLAAADWYESRREGLGVEFVAEVDVALDTIAEHPEAWPTWRSNRPYRRRALQRFPFVIFYRVLDSERVEVTAVAHSKRRPGYWLSRPPR